VSPDSATGESGATRSRLLDALRADPARTAILSDVDGTLAPIVERPEQALDCFLRTDMDTLVMGPHMLSKAR